MRETFEEYWDRINDEIRLLPPCQTLTVPATPEIKRDFSGFDLESKGYRVTLYEKRIS